MNYGFFHYKYNPMYDGTMYNGQDYDSFWRPTYTWFSIISIFILCFLFRKTKKETFIKYLKIISIFMIAFEIAKVTWESYWDLKTGQGLNVGGILSLETCSLFMYTAVVAAFTKNEKVQDYCLTWLSTLGFVGGMSNVLFPQGMKWYPVFTFGCFHSLIYHYVMVFTAMFIVFTRIRKFTFHDIIKAFIVHMIFSIPVIILDYIFGWNYMLYRDPGAVPLVSIITDKLLKTNFAWLNTPILVFAFLVMAAVLVSIYVGVYKLIDIIKGRKANTTKVA